MRYCTKCGKELIEGQKFCTVCGTATQCMNEQHVINQSKDDKSNPMQENEVLIQNQNADTGNFNRLYEMHKNELYYFALKKTGIKEDAEEIVQDTFINVFKKFDTLKDKNAFKAWLYQICNRKCIEMYRKRGRLVEREEEDYTEFENYIVEEDDASLPYDALLTREIKDAVLRLVDELPEAQKTTVLLYYFEDLSVKEIAEIQECSENTVKGRLLYARKTIKEKIENTRKKGVSLLNFAPFPLLAIFLKEEALASTLPAEASKAIWNAVLETILSSSAAASASIGAAATGAGVAAKAGISISTKVIIAVSGVSLAATISAVAMLNKPDETINQPEIVATSPIPSLVEEAPNILLDTEDTAQETTVFESVTWDDYAKLYYDDYSQEAMDAYSTISAGSGHSMAIRTNGELWGWGSNYYGQIGDGTTTDKHNPVKIMSDVVTVSAGWHHTMALKTNGELWAWGLNTDGQLGDGTTTSQRSPVKIMSDVESVSTGAFYSTVIKTNGELWAWGNYAGGQPGYGTNTNKSTPVKIMDDVASVSAGVWYTMAIKANGELWAWGNNEYGQLGDGTTTDRSTPVKIMDKVASVCAEQYHTVAIKSNGEVWAWGLNTCGQLGDGTTTDRLTPVKIMSDVTLVSAGNYYTMAIKTNGELWACGYNLYGELGDGTINTNRHTPVKIMDDISLVSVGYSHAIALKTTGELWAWGDNDCGKLGNGTTNSRWAPGKVMDGIMLPKNIAVSTTSNFTPTATPSSAVAMVGIISRVNNDNKSMDVLDTKTGKFDTLFVDGATELKDKFGISLEFEEFKVGDIVDIQYKKSGKTLLHLKISPQYWEHTEVSKVKVNTETKTISYGSDKYNYGDNLIVLYKGREYAVSELSALSDVDLVTIRGYQDKALYINILKKHGTIRLEENKDILNGTVEIGANDFIALESREIKVLEGRHKIIVRGSNIQPFMDEITVDAGEKYKLNLKDVVFIDGTMLP